MCEPLPGATVQLLRHCSKLKVTFAGYCHYVDMTLTQTEIFAALLLDWHETEDAERKKAEGGRRGNAMQVEMRRAASAGGGGQ